MVVPVPDQLEYISDANGVTKDFPYPTRFLQKDEIVVVLRDTDGIDTPQYLNQHYTIAGSSWPNGGTISFMTAPQAPNKVVRYRMTQAKQTVVLNNLSRNDAPSVEMQLDRLTMGLQDRGAFLERLRDWLSTTVIGLKLETAARIAGDLLLHGRVDREIKDRENGDKAVASLIGQAGPIQTPFYESAQAVSFATIKSTINKILIGRDEYERVAAEPSHPNFVQSLDGAFWELSSSDSILLPFGGQTGSAYENFDKSKGFKMHPVIAVFGDSNTAWVASEVPGPSGRIGTGQGSWPAYLHNYMVQHVYYAEGRVRGDGQPGDGLFEAIEDLPAYFNNFQPQIFINGFATNDIRNGRTLKQFLQDERYVINECFTRGIAYIRLGIPWRGPPNDPDGSMLAKTKEWNAALKQNCDTYGVPFISDVWPFATATGTYFAADGVHFTDALNQAIASMIWDTILENYGLPRDKFITKKVALGGAAGQWELPGLIHTFGKSITAIQTPDQYVRRFYPYALEIPAGQEVSFRADGPAGVLVSSKSHGTLTLNGADQTLLNRQTVQFVSTVSSRMNGSSLEFRVGAKAGTDAIHILGFSTWHDTVRNQRFRTIAEVNGGAYTPAKVSEIAIGNATLLTCLAPLGAGTKRGYDPQFGFQNVGSSDDRNAITTTYLPVGFRFLVMSTGSLWFWTGTAWAPWP